METKTNIAQLVDGIDSEKARYNTEVIKVLSDKTILAWILKYTVREFANYSIADIRECIEGKPEVHKRKVLPGKTPENIVGMDTAVLVLDEGESYFDIYFCVYLPDDKFTKLIINVEAQNDYYESYDIVTRGIFYCARMISAQYGTEFVKSNFQDLKKVYSIWICPNVPQKVEYTISDYRLGKIPIYGVVNEEYYYDLMEVVIINLGKDLDKSKGDQLHGLLSTLLSSAMNASEKKKVLEQEFGIETSVEVEGEMRTMCNLADGIVENAIERGLAQGIAQGLEQGIAQGMEQGMAEGIEQGKIETLASLVLDGVITKDDAVKRASVSEQKFDEILSKLQK